jgi:hypothetical protein
MCSIDDCEKFCVMCVNLNGCNTENDVKGINNIVIYVYIMQGIRLMNIHLVLLSVNRLTSSSAQLLEYFPNSRLYSLSLLYKELDRYEVT